MVRLRRHKPSSEPPVEETWRRSSHGIARWGRDDLDGARMGLDPATNGLEPRLIVHPDRGELEHD